MTNDKFIIKPFKSNIYVSGREKLPQWKETICKWLKIVPEREKHYKGELYFEGKPEVMRNYMLYEPKYGTKWIVTNIIGNRADIIILTQTTENIKSITEFVFMGSAHGEMLNNVNLLKSVCINQI